MRSTPAEERQNHFPSSSTSGGAKLRSHRGRMLRATFFHETWISQSMQPRRSGSPRFLSPKGQRSQNKPVCAPAPTQKRPRSVFANGRHRQPRDHRSSRSLPASGREARLDQPVNMPFSERLCPLTARSMFRAASTNATWSMKGLIGGHRRFQPQHHTGPRHPVCFAKRQLPATRHRHFRHGR